MQNVLPIIDKLRSSIEGWSSNSIYYICLFVVIPIIIFISITAVILVFRRINKLEKDQDSSHMREMNAYIIRGAKLFLKDEGKMLAVITLVLFVPVGLNGTEFLDNAVLSFMLTSLIFFIGSGSSYVASYIGMLAATKANILVVESSKKDPEEGFKIAYYGGMITGILNITMFVIGIWLIFILTGANIYMMVSFDFGASVSALLAQVGGGIYTKSADMGADLAGKYEMGISEDNPNNPAIIADLVGDNVGDCAGRGADLFESASSDSIGGMLLGLTLFLYSGDPIFVITNLTLVSLGTLSLYFSLLFLKINFEKPSASIWRVFIATTLFNVGMLYIANRLFFGELGNYLFISSLIGLVSMFLVIILTTYYTSIDYKPTKRIAEASSHSPSLNVISGLANGFSSVFLPVIIFSLTVIIAYKFGHSFGEEYFLSELGSTESNILGGDINHKYLLITFGIWGVNMASISSDVIISTVLTFDTFGPIMDNAAGITELCPNEAPDGLRENLDRLDSLGNTTKAVAKGFALICGGLSSIVMFLTFLQSTSDLAGDLSNPFIGESTLTNIFDNIVFHNPIILMGFFIGVAIPVFFSGMLIKAVHRGAEKMVKEVKNQFETIDNLLEDDDVKPDYERCIDISARSSLKNMAKPVLGTLSVVIVIGILFGPLVVGSLLIGNLIGCIIFGLFMSVGGGAMDNAKKGIEDGMHGGKGTVAHSASIIGDTVGDPLKDCTGPSMNIIITTINTLAITFLPLFIQTGYLWKYVLF